MTRNETNHLMNRFAKVLTSEEREGTELAKEVGVSTDDAYLALRLLAEHGWAHCRAVKDGLRRRWFWRLATPEEPEDIASGDPARRMDIAMNLWIEQKRDVRDIPETIDAVPGTAAYDYVSGTKKGHELPTDPRVEMIVDPQDGEPDYVYIFNDRSFITSARLPRVVQPHECRVFTRVRR